MNSLLSSITYGGDPRVYYIGNNGHVYEYAWHSSDSTWHNKDVTAEAGGQPAVDGSAFTSINDGFDNIYVYYFGNNNHVYELANEGWVGGSWVGGSWHSRDVTAYSGGQPALSISSLSSTTNYTPFNRHVYYLGKNYHVYEYAWHSSDSTWHNSDVTVDSGGQPTLSISLLSSITYVGDPRVYYIGNNYHVYEYAWHSSDRTWHNRDVTVDSGGQPALPASPLSSITYVGDPRVYYYGNNGHVYEYAWHSSDSTWHNRDVTVDSGGQPAENFRELSSITYRENPRVYYFGDNSHVYEYAWHSSDSTWHNRDVTVDSGGQPAVRYKLSSIIYGGDPRVYYIGNNYHVYEYAWHSSNSTWHNRDVTADTVK
ncbi:hypothetical protein [Methanosarcina vacuolata]|uniref:Uncharacterized protein n=1 Tax=Methanosarcina vacuolata Z-761 TaxID=1434123 RepID=A0A0E3Q7W4_9EURY|nr:hypothetical protein [Methanosarcina vacuolata]AKB45063.1 hypothetical protein MSVAZ_2794 [Methanosarcina vacuolata Z-761]